DIGFMQRADIISPSAVMQYVNQTVTPHFREKVMFIGVWQNRNFDGDVLDHGLYVNWFGTTSNYWTPNFTLLVTPESFDDRLTRGGPVAKSAFYWSADAGIGTDERTFELDTRADWTVTSRLSFQLFLQPFVAAGDYHDYRSLVAARRRDYAPTAQTSNPDFNFRSLRGNAVVRWEFRPGSALYVAWNENRADVAPLGD